MESFKWMYFSDSIGKMHHNRIRKQLESGNSKMKKDLHPIIVRKDGDNLFQYIELGEYLKLFEVSDEYIVVGAVKSYSEFTEFLEQFINECIENNVVIEKENIINYLKNK